jgi:hypothetical protein
MVHTDGGGYRSLRQPNRGGISGGPVLVGVPLRNFWRPDPALPRRELNQEFEATGVARRP